MRYPFKSALTVAIALAQIGEFSFILATIGRELGILTAAATNTLVADVDCLDRPESARSTGPSASIERWLAARPRLWALLNRRSCRSLRPEAAPAPARRTPIPRHRAVVIGYGPTGRTVVRLLRDNGIVPTVVELNMDTVRALRQDGIDAIYGDATRPETLEAAGVATRRQPDSHFGRHGQQHRGHPHRPAS